MSYRSPERPHQPYDHYRPIYQTDGTIITWGDVRNEREMEDLKYMPHFRAGQEPQEGPELNEGEIKQREEKVAAPPAPPPSPDLSQEIQRDMAEEAVQAHTRLANALNAFSLSARQPIVGCLGRVVIEWPNQYCEKVSCTVCPFVGYYWSVDGERVNPHALPLSALSTCGQWQSAARRFLEEP